MSANSIALEAPLVASPNQAMRAIQVSRKKLYELINAGELESYTEGKSRRITVKSINEYIERRLAAEAARRGRATSDRKDQTFLGVRRGLRLPSRTAMLRTRSDEP
jgi:excisionase family DNA binding protein